MVSASADINPMFKLCARNSQVTELTGFLAYMCYSTTEIRLNVKQFCCRIDESVTLYLIKFVTQLY
jgi:hypothetical protein